MVLNESLFFFFFLSTQISHYKTEKKCFSGKHKEKIQTTCKETPGRDWNPGTSCCKVTRQTITQLDMPQLKLMKQKKFGDQ